MQEIITEEGRFKSLNRPGFLLVNDNEWKRTTPRDITLPNYKAVMMKKNSLKVVERKRNLNID